MAGNYQKWCSRKWREAGKPGKYRDFAKINCPPKGKKRSVNCPPDSIPVCQPAALYEPTFRREGSYMNPASIRRRELQDPMEMDNRVPTFRRDSNVPGSVSVRARKVYPEDYLPSSAPVRRDPVVSLKRQKSYPQDYMGYPSKRRRRY